MSTIATQLVLFDGVCNLCERAVRFIIRRDRAARFRFCALQTATARKILRQHQLADEPLASVLLYADGVLYSKAAAALRIARQLDGAWPLFYYLFGWLPAPVADPVYDFIGRRRYRWFGKKTECWLPGAELRQRFIED